jgi:hypothetical protein
MPSTLHLLKQLLFLSPVIPLPKQDVVVLSNIPSIVQMVADIPQQ